MTVMDDETKLFIEAISKTLMPGGQVEGEKIIKSYQSHEAYPMKTLLIAEMESMDISIRASAAILLKNYIKHNWHLLEDEPERIKPEYQSQIKARLIPLMIAANTSKVIRNQASECIFLIASLEFPLKWKDFIKDLLSFFNVADNTGKVYILMTLNLTFKKYRHEFRTNSLFTEINIVMEQFGSTLLSTFKTVDSLNFSKEGNELMLPLVKIFYSLSFQDLPEFIEDNLVEFMRILLKYLSNFESTNELLEIKEGICDIINLYLMKYDEEFSMLSEFISTIWNLLMSLSMDSKNDGLAGRTIHILSSISRSSRHVSLLGGSDILQNICEKIVLPNVQIRDSDEELFIEEPLEFIKKNLEDSGTLMFIRRLNELDTESRRRASCDLIRGLMTHFEGQLTTLFLNYIQQCLQSNDWKLKDTAFQMFVAMAMKGNLTQHGVSETNRNVDINDFILNFVLPEISNQSSNLMLKVDAIYIILVFRNQLNDVVAEKAVPLLMNFTNCKESIVPVVYAACCFEKSKKILSMANGSQLFGCLLTALRSNESLRMTEYLMKTTWKVLAFNKFLSSSNGMELVRYLLQFIDEAAKRPIDAKYNHYLFECLAVALKYLPADQRQSVDSLFYPIAEFILQNDISDFIPYVFQILALCLSFHAKKGAPGTSFVFRANSVEAFTRLLPTLLTPFLWETHANIPALIKLLKAYVYSDPKFVHANFMQQYLGVFQKLLFSKSLDHHAFELVDSMIRNLSLDLMRPHLQPMFILIFQRLQSLKTAKFSYHFLLFLSTFLLTNSADSLIQVIDAIQPNLFGMLLKSVVIEEIPKVLDLKERQTCCVAFTTLLIALPAVYEALKPSLLVAIFKGLPESTPHEDDEVIWEEIDHPIESVAFSRLVSIGKDEFARIELPDAQSFLVESFKKASFNISSCPPEFQQSFLILCNK